MKSIRTFLKIFLLAVFLLSSVGNAVKAQEKTEKKESGLKKDLKKIAKILSFGGKLKHSDSAKLARKYIREQQKLLREGGNYPYNLNTKPVGSSSNNLVVADNFELGKEVLGWYPFWEKDLYKTLDYKLLSTIAYFAYEVNPKNGKAKNVHDWNTTPLLDSARVHGKKVLLTVSNFGRYNNRRLLRNQKSTATLIKNLIQLISTRGAHGICVDFEGVHKSERNLFSAFISQLKLQLKAANKSYELYLTLPSVDWEQYLDFESISPYVDSFVIMGYDYYGQASSVAGPVAPLQSGKIWQRYNIELSVDFYLSNGIPSSSLLLALPYYGSIWETDSGKRMAKAKRFIGSRTYDYIKEKIKSPIQYDSISKSMWSAYAVQGGKAPFRQVWFDNMNTFSTKLEYLKKKKLKGLGIWALGYNKVNKDLWKAVANNLSKPSVAISDANNSNQGNGVNDPDNPNDPITNSEDANSDNITDQNTNNQTTEGENPTVPTDPTKNQEENGKPKTENSFLKKLTDIEYILREMTTHKTLLLSILLLVVIFGGVGFIIAMFQQDTRSYFFTNTAQTVYYSLVIISCLLVLFRWTGKINDLSVVLIIGFIMGSVSGYLVYKILEQINRDRP
ncbi:glycosyl hydrolase family 18 protein [Ascidiimonas sp. W6]|uniref:glycosyl hydrolase family 18 protein n=1 Tax=Ascidiimonas meishanensis TaxID=3128903 RepID=UPI0030EF2401